MSTKRSTSCSTYMLASKRIVWKQKGTFPSKYLRLSMNFKPSCLAFLNYIVNNFLKPQFSKLEEQIKKNFLLFWHWITNFTSTIKVFQKKLLHDTTCFFWKLNCSAFLVKYITLPPQKWLEPLKFESFGVGSGKPGYLSEFF